MHISTWSFAPNARWLFFLRVHLWEPNGGYAPLNLQNVQIQICDIVTVTLCPLHAMELDESGSLHGGSTEAGVEYLNQVFCKEESDSWCSNRWGDPWFSGGQSC